MIKKLLQNVSSFIFDKLLPIPSIKEKGYILELRNDFRQLQKLNATMKFISEAIWLSRMNILRKYVFKRDPRRFLRWDVITETMFVGNASYIPIELQYLKNCSDWDVRWHADIKESSIGHPVSCTHFPESSGNLIHHAYHVAQFEEKIGTKVHNINYVFEFGGGYGSMCRLLFNLGFNGKYVIFDLPPFSALQRYYLKNIGLNVQSVDDFKNSETGIICFSDFQELETLIKEQTDKSNSIFIATWSISETPANLRETILPLTAQFNHFLIAYQDRFGEINNLDYFRNWQKTNKSVKWCNFKNEHLPNNNYIFGKKCNVV